MRNIVLLATAALILVLVNYSIWQRECLITTGRTVLLELAPVDPRSLMQGDYMALRFKVATDAFSSVSIKGMRDGRIVLTVDSRTVGTFKRFDDGKAAAGEALLRFRIRNGEPKFATNAFFFQEKHGEYYTDAKFGEFRVSPEGEAILVALRGKDLQKLGPGDGGKR